jgi:flagellar assembly protein FliH
LSKIIKPADEKAFESAEKFKKELFRPGIRPKAGEDDVFGDDAPGRPEFNVTESAAEAAEKLKKAEGRAELIIREAEERAEGIYRQARERGRADGAREAAELAGQERRKSEKTLASFIARMKERESDLAKSLVPGLAELAAELASKIIHREVARDSLMATRQAEQAIRKIIERESLLIRVNPSDEESMKGHKPLLAKMFDGVNKIEVIGDPKVERGGCIVETDHIKVDAQPGTQLNAARRALIDEAEK